MLLLKFGIFSKTSLPLTAVRFSLLTILNADLEYFLYFENKKAERNLCIVPMTSKIFWSVRGRFCFSFWDCSALHNYQCTKNYPALLQYLQFYLESNFRNTLKEHVPVRNLSQVLDETWIGFKLALKLSLNWTSKNILLLYWWVSTLLSLQKCINKFRLVWKLDSLFSGFCHRFFRNVI